MKKSSWKLILIIVAGILAVVMLGVFGVQSSQNKAFSLEEQVNTADSDIKVTLLLTLPLEVLMDHFWKKSYPQKIPKFADLLIEYYEKWQDGELDLDELKEDLWKYGGVKFREGQINGK